MRMFKKKEGLKYGNVEGMSVVVGATSVIGRSIVRRLACLGHNVTAVDTDGEKLRELEKEMNVSTVIMEKNEKTTTERITTKGGSLSGLVIVPPENVVVDEDIINASSRQFDEVKDTR